MSPTRNKVVVAELLNALEDGDVNAVLARLTDDATWWVAGDLPISGDHDRAAIEQMIAGQAAMVVPPIKFTPVGFIAEGDRVSVETESAADLKNGKHYSNKYHLVFEFEGDLISRVREYMDTKRVVDILFS
ncbi:MULTISPECIES: nuclear transport factor 2 family protein [unclassified Mycobacterium]|uniref:nuclear transport factor 2 family protein n=1 Tax=unclassified Mycobacterium TaxID=2642494 RepID=UPI0029C880FE|nr:MULTISPECIES: nuclear transport factor 2 family protein [unclassified Mycobacterium]